MVEKEVFRETEGIGYDGPTKSGGQIEQTNLATTCNSLPKLFSAAHMNNKWRGLRTLANVDSAIRRNVESCSQEGALPHHITMNTHLGPPSLPYQFPTGSL